MTFYLLVKFVHVFVAITLVGGATGVGFAQRLAARQPGQLGFVLQIAQRYYRSLFGPGLILLMISGFWMAATGWRLDLFWIRAALVITAVVLILMYALELPNYGRLARATELETTPSADGRRAARIAQISGGIGSLLIVLVIWLMVTKP